MIMTHNNHMFRKFTLKLSLVFACDGIGRTSRIESAWSRKQHIWVIWRIVKLKPSKRSLNRKDRSEGFLFLSFCQESMDCCFCLRLWRVVFTCNFAIPSQVKTRLTTGFYSVWFTDIITVLVSSLNRDYSISCHDVIVVFGSACRCGNKACASA